MAKAPKVQSVGQLMKELKPAYNSSRKNLDQQAKLIGKETDANIEGLYAQRGRDFDQISDTMNQRGAIWSGITADEMARYSATEFLPGIQQAQLAGQKGKLELQGKRAEMDKEIRTTAIGRRDQQVQALNTWNLQEARNAFEAKQSKIQRQWDGRQRQLDRDHQSAMSAADRAAQAARASQTAAVAPSGGAIFRDKVAGLLRTEGQKAGTMGGSTARVLYNQATRDWGMSRSEALSQLKPYISTNAYKTLKRG